MKLTEAQENDIRGFRWLFENDNNVITLFEVKKGFARGGQYHKKEVRHILLSGKSEYRKMNINTKIETREIVSGMKIITLPPFCLKQFMAHSISSNLAAPVERIRGFLVVAMYSINLELKIFIFLKRF